jgi:hypothetical protein
MTKWFGNMFDKKTLWGTFEWSDLTETRQQTLERQRKKKNNPGPSVLVPGALDANVTLEEYISSLIDEYQPLLLKGLGVAGLGALGYMMYLEAQGKPTLISRLVMSSAGAEMIRGAWSFLGHAAQAGASNPALGFMTGWVAIQLMQKAKLVTEKAGAYATAGLFGLEGVSVASDLIGALVPSFFGGKDSTGPNTLTFGDDAHMTYISEMPGPVFDLIKQNGYELPGVKRAALKA